MGPKNPDLETYESGADRKGDEPAGEMESYERNDDREYDGSDKKLP